MRKKDLDRPDPSTVPVSSDLRGRVDPDADTVVPPDRRSRVGPREPRYPYEVPVVFTLYGRTLAGRVKDLGARGLFVQCDPPAPLDVVLSFELLTPGGALPVRGRVVWMRTRENHPEPGFGLTFEDLDHGVREVLENLLTQLARRASQRSPAPAFDRG